MQAFNFCSQKLNVMLYHKLQLKVKVFVIYFKYIYTTFSDHGFDTIDKSVKRNDPDAISLSTYVDQDLIDFQFAYGPLALVQAKPGYEREVADALRGFV